MGKSQEKAYVWTGKGSSEEEQTLGSELAKKLGVKKPDIINEKDEPKQFWKTIGGKGEYASDPCLADPHFEARLFQVSNASGALRVEEIFDFLQEDLIEDDVMLLDTYSTVYVWIGDYAHQEEKKEA